MYGSTTKFNGNPKYNSHAPQKAFPVYVHDYVGL